MKKKKRTGGADRGDGKRLRVTPKCINGPWLFFSFLSTFPSFFYLVAAPCPALLLIMSITYAKERKDEKKKRSACPISFSLSLTSTSLAIGAKKNTEDRE